MRGGVITVSADGTILDLHAEEQVDSLAGVEFYSGILIPGLVNAHSHLELSYLKGTIKPGGGFVEFAAGMSTQRGRFTSKERIAAAAYQDARLWAEGVEAVGDVCNGSTTFELKTRSHIRYLNFLELFGLGCSSTAPLQSVAMQATTAGLTTVITPHATYSLNRDAFSASIAAGPTALPLSIHFMETPDEAELFHDRGALRQWYDQRGLTTDFTDRYASPAARIVAEIPASRKVMLIHNTCVTEAEVDLLQAHFGENLTWVLCPRSNRHITGLTPPETLLRRKGVRIALGTDSLASNSDLSLIEELKCFPNTPLEELLRSATLTGAEALGLEDTLGSFEEGKRPGIVRLTGVDLQHRRLTPEATTRRIL